ncbi:MAG: carbohydrate ABC transporter permease [Chloroflexota bacterium]|nr:carbohydrate ABC transporter permease [Chloroflexota bacterium]
MTEQAVQQAVVPSRRQASAVVRFWRRYQSVIREVFSHLVLVPLAIIFMIPFFWMVSTSLKPDTQIFLWPPVWIPKPFMWSNYPEALSFIPFWAYVKNTLVIAFFAIVGALFSCPPVAYSFSRIPWAGRDTLFMMTIATMMLPYQVTMIPLFIIFSRVGWVGTYLPLIVPHFFGGAFYIFLLRQFFMTIPAELTDAARIDGASELRIYSQLILPLSKPALATITLFEFLARWRDFLGPLIYLNTPEKYTISLGLQMYRMEHSTEWALLMAASIVLTAPVIILYFFVQRTFIQGITLTGLKGV